MIVALTGASGLIGSYTARSLKAAGHRVRALVRRGSRRDHINAVVDEWAIGDFYDPQTAAGLAAGVDCVIHAAADSMVSQTSPTLQMSRNVMGSLGLLEAARVAGVGQFLFTSAIGITGETGNAQCSPLSPCPEDLYGAGKAAVEAHLSAYHSQFGMNTCAFRLGGVYGLHPDLRRSRWYSLVAAALSGHAVSAGESGHVVAVEDVADALALAVGDQTVAGQVYNLADTCVAWEEMVQMAIASCGEAAGSEEPSAGSASSPFGVSQERAWFARHARPRAIQRGMDGVRQYLEALRKAMPA